MLDVLKERKQIALTFCILHLSRWHNIDSQELFNSQCQDARTSGGSGGCGQKDPTSQAESHFVRVLYLP